MNSYYTSDLFTATANDNQVEQILNFTNSVVGTQASNFNPTTLGSWFTFAAYKGAVSSSDTWISENWVKL